MLSGFLATAVGDFETRFQFTGGVHETPFIFPFLTGGIELDLPGFIESFEPLRGLATTTTKESRLL